MNRIPESLGKPFLRDAIVEVRFTARVADNLLPGIFYERLREHGWTAPSAGIQASIALNFGVQVGTAPEPVFNRGAFRLHATDGRIFFNINGTYPGWSSTYLPMLRETLPLLLADDPVTPVRVGLRYINDIPTANIFEETGRFTNAPLQGFETDKKAIRWTMHQGETAIILNMASNLSRGSEPGRNSVIDVDLQRPIDDGATTDVQELLQLIDQLHLMNKQIVFGHLLPEQFVARFDPTYD